MNLKKKNKAAILVSNEALTGLQWFRINGSLEYNEIVSNEVALVADK